MIISLKVSDLHLPSQLATTAADLVSIASVPLNLSLSLSFLSFFLSSIVSAFVC